MHLSFVFGPILEDFSCYAQSAFPNWHLLLHTLLYQHSAAHYSLYEKCSNNEWLLFTEVISCYISIIAWICLASSASPISQQ